MTEPKCDPCPECGGDCAPECGMHPAGCHYGGFTEMTAYWLVVDGCDRDHGERATDGEPERRR